MTIETLPKAWEPIRDKMARAMYIDWFNRNEDLPVYDDLPDEDRIYWTEQADVAMLAFVNAALESELAQKGAGSLPSALHNGIEAFGNISRHENDDSFPVIIIRMEEVK